MLAMKTIAPDSFRALQGLLEKEYGPQPSGVWEAALIRWRKARDRGEDPEHYVRDGMPELIVAATPSVPQGPRSRGGPKERKIVAGDRTEHVHAHAVAQRIERIGNADPDVRQFRQESWGTPRPLSAIFSCTGIPVTSINALYPG